MWKWDAPGHRHSALCPLAHSPSSPSGGKPPAATTALCFAHPLTHSPSQLSLWLPMVNWPCWVVLQQLGGSELTEATLWWRAGHPKLAAQNCPRPPPPLFGYIYCPIRYAEKTCYGPRLLRDVIWWDAGREPFSTAVPAFLEHYPDSLTPRG